MSSARLLRSGGSFAIVLVAYWIYAFLVVPWIEPAADPQQTAQITQEQEQNAELARQAKIQELVPLFPPGSPFLSAKTPMLEGPQLRVLYETLTPTEQGTRYLLTPCAVVYMPEEPADNLPERIRRSLVMEVPEGAELQFGEAFDLLHTKMGLPISGRLRGPVTIRSAGNDPGPDDDLLAVTKDIHLTNDRIWTNEPVEFTWGRSYGRGRNLTVALQHANGASGPSGRMGKIDGIEWLELRHLDQLHLEPSGRPGTKGAASRSPAAGTSPLAMGNDGEPLVLDVSVAGSLRFEVAKRVAKLSGPVEILQQHRNGMKDRLTCAEMLIDFTYRRKTTPEPANSTMPANTMPTTEAVSLSDLQPWQIRASGNPVDIQAPSREFQGKCNLLTYNLSHRRIRLEGTPEAFIQQGTRELHARTLEYQAADDPRLTVVMAKGPGLVRAVEQQAEGQRVLMARWANELRLAPDSRDPQQQPCLTLQGDVQVESPGFGWLQAETIDLWLSLVPPTAGQPMQVRPDRMQAYPQVRLDSPQLSGTFGRLELWFKELDAQQAAQERQKLAGVGLYPQIQSRLEQAQLATQLARNFSGSQQTQRPVLESPPAGPTVAAAGMPANNHFNITANRLRAQVVLRGQKPEPAELTVEGNVHILQTASERPDQRPVLIQGDQIVVDHAMQPYATLRIVGQRAHFEGQGLGLTGANITLDRGQNRLWINGPGEMTLLLAQDLEGRPVAHPETAVIQWQQGMNFDGKLVTFSGSVVGRTQQQQFQTEQLDATFDRFIHFAEMRGQPRPDLATLTCHGEVVVQDHTPDKAGQPTRTDMVIRELSIDRLTGEIKSVGPGWMSSIRRGATTMLVPDNLAARPAAAPTADENQLNYLNVRFQDGLRGNIHERRVTFQQRIRAIYGPVPSFDAKLDADDPNGPKPGETRIDADELSVVQMQLPNDQRRTSIELETRSNTIVQGTTAKGEVFTARADRLNYVEAKNVLTLAWDGTNYAQLFYQQSAGAVPVRHEAQMITICPKPWDVKTYGPRVTSGEFPAIGRRGG